MRVLYTFVLFFILSAPLFAAADESKGVDYYKADQIEAARDFFTKQLNDPSANKAEAYYYLGEIAFGDNDTQAALDFYKKGLEADPNYIFNSIGEAKIMLASNKSGAVEKFNQMIKQNKKNVEVSVAIARAYFDNKMYDEANEQLELARKINRKYAGIFLLSGDMLAAQNKSGDAAGQYEQAIYFDSKCKEAYLKYARVYQWLNSGASIAKLQEVLAIDPDYMAAYRDLGEIYYERRDYPESVENYSKYINAGIYSNADLVRYASLLFFNAEYDKSLQILDQALAKDPQSVVARRLKIYSLYELGRYAESAKEADKFTDGVPDSQIIRQDYLYYARALSKGKMDSLAVDQFKKAIAMDTTKIDLYKELGEVYESMGKFNEAIPYFEKYLSETDEGNKTALLMFNMGRAYYLEARKITDTVDVDQVTKKENYFKKADDYFKVVTEKIPDSYLGYLWRAKVHVDLDPNTELGLAKPYYEKVVSIIFEKNEADKRQRDLIEAYTYFAFYSFVIQADYVTAEEYCKKILEIDPNNGPAKTILDGIPKK